MGKIEEHEGKKYLITDKYGIRYKSDSDPDPYFH